MNYEIIALSVLLVLGIMLLIEFLWLYSVADKQEQTKIKEKKSVNDSKKMINAILACPTESARNEELNALAEFCKDDFNKDIVCKELLQIIPQRDSMIAGKQKSLDAIIKLVNPVDFYFNMLDADDVTQKGYACLKLAEFNAKDKIDDVRELLKKKNRVLKYDAGMTLVVFGDKEGTMQFVYEIQNDRFYSYRILNEVVDRYTGDLYELVKEIIDNCDNYVIASVLKSVGKFKMPELLDYIFECVQSTNESMRIAGVKALSNYDDPNIIHDLIILSKDNNWVVREYAVKGLGNFSREDAIEAVEKAINDEQWWVRQEAAKSIIKMDKSLEHVEKIVKGYDRYASEAILHSLYRTLDVQEEKK